MFMIIVMAMLFAYCAWFAVQTVVPAGPRGIGRLAAKDRLALVVGGLIALSAALSLRIFISVGWMQTVSWLVIGLLSAVAVGFAVVRWQSLPTRRPRTNRRSGEQRPRSWVVAGPGLGLTLLFLIFSGFVFFAGFVA